MNEKIEQARILQGLGRPEHARELLAEVLADEHGNVEALTAMADVCYWLDDYAKALEYSESALSHAPQDAFAGQVRAHAAYQLSVGAPRRSAERRKWLGVARTAARRALDIDATDPANHVTHAVVWARKDPQAALASIERALELDPEYIDAFHVRAFIFRVALLDEDRAAEALHEVLRLDPDNADAVHNLGRVDSARGDLDDAEARLREAGRLDPGRAGRIRRDLDRVRTRRALQSPPSSEQARAHQETSPSFGDKALTERAHGSGPAPEHSQPLRVSPPVVVHNGAVLVELRRCDADRWRSAESADIERAVAELAELRQARPEDADLVYESALADWLCGRRRAAITRLRKISRLDPERAGQADAHIATLEAEDQRAAEALAAQREVRARREEHKAETEVERAAEAAIARRQARERAKARQAQAGGSNRADLDAAVRVERPGAAARNRWHWLVVVPLIFLVKMSLHGCATDNSHQGTDRQRSVYTPTTMDPDVLRRLIETPGPPPR
ncbi:tetratricopeptide repeat protein [Nocardia tengchongensis]|uniref:tetratricopeptide repeat protein n=1 Tax=Nocardia tengchongensis TaxID=2055889 RepID=UPI00369B9C1D